LALQNASTLNTIKLRGSPMDSSIIAAASAIFGSIIGGLTTFATTLLEQRYVASRDCCQRT
jgi:hypothetical protein